MRRLINLNQWLPDKSYLHQPKHSTPQKKQQVTVITRKAYGGAYDVMSSKHLRGDANFACVLAFGGCVVLCIWLPPTPTHTIANGLDPTAYLRTPPT